MDFPIPPEFWWRTDPITCNHLKIDFRNHNSEIKSRNKNSEIRIRKPEIRNQNSEIRIQILIKKLVPEIESWSNSCSVFSTPVCTLYLAFTGRWSLKITILRIFRNWYWELFVLYPLYIFGSQPTIWLLNVLQW